MVNNSNSVTFQKTKRFAVKIIRFANALMADKKEYIISRQVLRSGTAIGANTRESWNAQSKADFISKLSIALKEADETLYWLEILFESEMITREEFNDLHADLKEIIALLTSSIKTAKHNLETEKTTNKQQQK